MIAAESGFALINRAASGFRFPGLTGRSFHALNAGKTAAELVLCQFAGHCERGGCRAVVSST